MAHQYSARFLDWVVAQFEADPDYFRKARDAWRAATEASPSSATTPLAGGALPVTSEVRDEQAHDSTQFEKAMKDAGLDRRHGRRRPKRVAGDKGYNFDRIRRWLRQRRMLAVIPYRENETARELAPAGGFDRRTYLRRSAIECSIGWARRIGTRFEKFATSFLGMLKLAIVKRYLRIAFSNRT